MRLLLALVTLQPLNHETMTGISVIQNVPGISVDFIVQVVGLSSNLGMNRFDLVATDNGTPVRSVRIPVVVNVINEPVASYTFTPTGTINVGTTVTFTNTVSINLPAASFLGNIKNLTMNGSLSSLRRPMTWSVSDWRSTASCRNRIFITATWLPAMYSSR